MKRTYIVILFFLTIIGNLNSQVLSNEIITAVKTCNVDDLTMLTTIYDIDQCFVKNNKSYTLILISIRLRNKNSLEFLINNGANVNGTCDCMTPIIYAVKYGHLDMVKILLKYGATLVNEKSMDEPPNVSYRL